jgi:hypothetical protein
LSVTCDRSVVSSTNKTDCHDITEMLLKVALNTIKQTNKHTSMRYGTDVYISTWLHSQSFLQFHPMFMLVAYVNSCFIIIRQIFFPVSFSRRISLNTCTTVWGFSISRHFFLQQQTSHMCSKRSPKVIWIGMCIVVQTGIYVRDVFSWK